MAGVRDYGYLGWAEGPPTNAFGVREAGLRDGRREILCVRTGHYGLALDTAGPRLLALARIDAATPAGEAHTEPSGRVIDLPAPRPGLERLVLRRGGTVYRCAGRGPMPKQRVDYPVRIIEAGAVLQRFDILGLRLKSADGTSPVLDGRLEVTAWPDRLSLRLEATGSGVSGDGASEPAAVWIPALASAASATEPPRVEVRDLRTDRPCPVHHDADRGWHRVELPCDGWRVAAEPDRLERYRVRIANVSDAARPVRLLFAKDGAFAGITGMSAMLRDERGRPTGIPVQLSKNWHRKKGHPLLHEGPWFHGFSILRMPASAETTLELSVAYARWGGVPAASHAQLSLVGWGHNQLWEEVAVGSWGESICYEPDAVQRRCRIDDIRPLMVWGKDRERARWTWTNNVGGGDFLVYFDERGLYRPLVDVRARYRAYGPNLTRVDYSGLTNDGAIRARITAETPRTDDMVRAFHRIRYDVLRKARPRRLALYQLGADHYLWYSFGRMARGTAKGLVEEWAPERGGRRYSRVAIPCEGEAPWLSLHESESRDPGGGAWANRGLVIRSWKARLGGREAPVPHVSVYGTHSNVPSASLELSLPAGVRGLEPGDFVEADLELVVVPQSADDYYGPNEGLRRALARGGDTWRPVWREALGNALRVRARRGTVSRRYPLEIRVDDDGVADVEIRGGVGYVPVTFRGLASPERGTLDRVEGEGVSPVDQSIHGNDYWQTEHDPVSGEWSRTYNVPLGPESAPLAPESARGETRDGMPPLRLRFR